MNKKLVVSVAFVVIVAVVIISFSTYYATLLETQKVAQDRFLASQQEPQQEFENGSPILGSESAYFAAKLGVAEYLVAKKYTSCCSCFA